MYFTITAFETGFINNMCVFKMTKNYVKFISFVCYSKRHWAVFRSVQMILSLCVYLKIMISSSLSWRLLYCCKQMLQWSCLGWSPLLTALRRCDRDQWRSEFNRFVVVSNNVWEKEIKIIAKVENGSRDTEQLCYFRWSRFDNYTVLYVSTVRGKNLCWCWSFFILWCVKVLVAWRKCMKTDI